MVTIKLDMDVGEAAFVVDGEELPYKARRILGTSPTPPPYLPIIPPYLLYISPLSPLYLLHVSPPSPLCLPQIWPIISEQVHGN